MKTTSNLNYFIGKPVTVISTAYTKFFSNEMFSNYFVGIVESIDENGILLKSLTNNCKSYYFLDNIISIAEELILNEDDPEDKSIIDEIKKEVVKNPNLKNQLIDIEALDKLTN
jgi:hypothetical protein